MGETILRSSSNMEICESQYGGTTPKAWADPEKGGQGVRTPWKITRYMGFYMEKAIGPRPLEKVGILFWKNVGPLWNLGR